MNSKALQGILNLRYQTEILESLDWDEAKLVQFFDYLETEFNNFELKHPDDLIASIEIHFGKNTADLIKDIFKDQFKSITIQSNGVNDEH
tara:strand:- start:368 stop:637 length:270 start_codon:yes stop_codon:yes gene_type:complete